MIRRWSGLTLAMAVLLSSVVLPAPAMAQDACAQTVTVQAGDTLSTIAGRTLGNSAAYDRIVAATNAAAATDDSFATIESANRLAVGWKLCIPGGNASPVSPPAPSGPRPSPNSSP